MTSSNKLFKENTMVEVFGATSTADDVLSGVNLKGKRILVTGVSAGIGLETARSLAAHGAQVVGAGFKQSQRCNRAGTKGRGYQWRKL
jgi:trans-2-enoyl-CoA reductase